jgi:hypothetical protein
VDVVRDVLELRRGGFVLGREVLRLLPLRVGRGGYGLKTALLR